MFRTFIIFLIFWCFLFEVTSEIVSCQSCQAPNPTPPFQCPEDGASSECPFADDVSDEERYCLTELTGTSENGYNKIEKKCMKKSDIIAQFNGNESAAVFNGCGMRANGFIHYCSCNSEDNCNSKSFDAQKDQYVIRNTTIAPNTTSTPMENSNVTMKSDNSVSKCFQFSICLFGFAIFLSSYFCGV